VSVGDIVLVYEKKQPRHLWKLGRVIELKQSRDGAVRSAKVLLGSTKITVERPVNKLYPVEKRK